MQVRRNPAWAELIQLLPILSLALPFMLEGKVDLGRAGGGFLLGAALMPAISVLVVLRGHVLNPILIGVGLWLGVGALAFQLRLEAVAGWLGSTQAFGLFLAAFAVGVVTTFLSPQGYVGVRSSDARWLRRASLALLGLTAAIMGWAWWFRHDIRLGGGAPFIVLNVARRALGRARAPRVSEP
jgi:hypothetical protein